MASLPQLQLVAKATEHWISAEEFCRLAGWKDRWLREQVLAGNIHTRTTGENGRNGKPLKEFAVSSLPPKARERFEAESQREQPKQSALSFFAPVAVAPSAPRVALTPEAALDASQRRELLSPILEYISHPGRYSALRLADGKAVRTQSDMVRFVSEQRTAAGKPVSEATLWRMLREYKKGGEAALAKKPRKDAGQSRWFLDHPEAAAMAAFVGFADGQGASVTAAHRALLQQGHKLNIAAHELPSYDTVRRFLDSAPADLKVLARKGEKKYGDLVAPYIQREYRDVFANQVWIADTMKADVEVQNDIYDWLAPGAPIRLQLSAIVDYRSRMFVGWCWGVVESSVPIAAALRNAVIAHGPAEHFYCDNGKAYLKVAQGAIRAHMVTPGEDLVTLYDDVLELEGKLGLLGRLGMSVTHCIPRHPQSKHIERQFRTVHEQYDSMWETYTAGAPHLRPEHTSHLMAVHRKAVKHNNPDWSRHPLASEYIAGFGVWLDWHHQQPMDAEGMDGRSPAEVFAQERNPRQRATPQLLQLADTFAERTTRIVDRCGIKMDGERYVPDPNDAQATACMLSLSGDRDDRRTVVVLYDTHDVSSVAVADERGRVLCTLIRQQRLQFAPHDPATQSAIKQGMVAQRGALRATKGKLAQIQRQGRLVGASTRLELLAENLPSPGPVSPALISQPKPRKIAAQTAAPMYAHEVGELIAAMED